MRGAAGIWTGRKFSENLLEMAIYRYVIQQSMIIGGLFCRGLHTRGDWEIRGDWDCGAPPPR